MKSLSGLSATRLLELIDSGEMTSHEVVGHFVERIAAVDPSVNAVVVRRFDEALAEADRADEIFRQGKRLGRLHGLPFTIKESLDLAGPTTTWG